MTWLFGWSSLVPMAAFAALQRGKDGIPEVLSRRCCSALDVEGEAFRAERLQPGSRDTAASWQWQRTELLKGVSRTPWRGRLVSNADARRRGGPPGRLDPSIGTGLDRPIYLGVDHVAGCGRNSIPIATARPLQTLQEFVSSGAGVQRGSAGWGLQN